MLIEFFPSFRDLSEQIDYFNSHYCNNRPENYDIEYRNNYCCVYFYNKETAFAFTEYINTLRLSNDFYHKVKMKLCYPSQISQNRSIIVKKVNPISLIKKNVSSSLSASRVPALFFHGTDDRTVPFSDGVANYEACASEKTMFTAEKAHHTVSYLVGGKEADDVLMNFINAHFSREGK